MEVGKGPFVELRMVLLSTSKQKESKRLDGVCNFENLPLKQLTKR